MKKTQNFSKELFVFGFIIVLFFLLISFLYYNVTKDIIILEDDIQPLFNNYEKKIPNDLIQSPEKLKFSYIVWLYFDNNSENSQWFSNFTSDKYILQLNNKKFLSYQPYNNSLKVTFGMKEIRSNTYSDAPSDTNVHQEKQDLFYFMDTEQEIEIHNIKLQKWIQIAIVLDNRNVDIFMDGILVKSDFLKNVPNVKNKDIILGKKKHNPNCFIGKLEMKPDLTNLNELNGLYTKDKNSFRINNDLRNQVRMDTIKIRKEQYKKEKRKTLEDYFKELNPS